MSLEQNAQAANERGKGEANKAEFMELVGHSKDLGLYSE